MGWIYAITFFLARQEIGQDRIPEKKYSESYP
jgi:hypothetical protein